VAPRGGCVALCGEGADCRAWAYRGEVYGVPPVELLEEAILKSSVRGWEAEREREASFTPPPNLEKNFAGRESLRKRLRNKPPDAPFQK